MQTATLSYKLIKKIKDEKFDEEKLQNYILLIQLSIRDFQVAVIDSSDARLIFFEDFVFSEVNSHSELFELLKTLFESHELLTAGFWKKVKVSIKNNKVIHVPTSLFIETAAEEYLKFNAQVHPEAELTLYCSSPASDAVSVFAMQKDLHRWLTELYSNSSLSFFHQSASLIEGVLNFSKSQKVQPLYIYVDRFKLHILSIQNHNLVYYNQFAIKQFGDYVKYIMLVMNALNLNQDTSQVVLWGYIGKNSPHYHEFYKYIRNVTFGDRPTHLKFGYMFDEVQHHHFFDLFSMNLLNH
ncbi:MAG: DUF3822 family protein [Bacteroidota bacterium]